MPDRRTSCVSVVSVVSVKKKALNERGFRDFQHWNEDIDHVYIGRNLSFYVPGTLKSKWANPFSVKKYGRTGCLEKYREYILGNTQLLTELDELRGKELGCWCKPESCHGDVLIELLNER